MSDDPSIQFIDGEVFTEDYLDGICEEANQLLQEAGSVRRSCTHAAFRECVAQMCRSLHLLQVHTHSLTRTPMCVQLRVVELASRFNVSSQFLTEGLKKRMGSIVQGRLDSSMLYTNTYIERQEACIRGALSGLTRPMAMADLQVETGWW